MTLFFRPHSQDKIDQNKDRLRFYGDHWLSANNPIYTKRYG